MPRGEPREPPLADPAQAVASIRAEVARLRAGLGRIENDLAILEATSRREASARERPERYLRVLVDVYERGGQHGVDTEGLAAIGRTHGYDRRGLGGFFTGRRAPLRRSEDRVRLTPHGEHLVDVYLHPFEP